MSGDKLLDGPDISQRVTRHNTQNLIRFTLKRRVHISHVVGYLVHSESHIHLQITRD